MIILYFQGRISTDDHGQVLRADARFLVFGFAATTLFDFFSAMYFFIARRLFCLLEIDGWGHDGWGQACLIAISSLEGI